ncbi:MAG: recombinase family protein [Acidimicrobiia bacterium]
MLTVAYCRVSTDEQATEGFSIEGQAEKLRTYAQLHDLGEVVVISDPGLSGKNLDRPGLQRLLAMIADGHVANVLTWRLDRLSRNLGDLILLADRCGQAGVALHSFTERLDLSSATGRMFYNILGSFAQFYREQLAENVRMGMHQAARQGRWINHAPTGYDLADGVLIANEKAPIIRQIFVMRAEGASHRAISEATGVNHSTVQSILRNRVYPGQAKSRDEWFPGLHEPLITEAQFEAAHRGRVKGRRRGRDLLSGHVRCGLCARVMTIDQRDDGRTLYRCRHRGQGCRIPRRPTAALLDAALLGLQLLGHDSELQEAIRREMGRDRADGRQAGARTAPNRRTSPDALLDRRRKLLGLYYDDQISAELFAEQEAELTRLIDLARGEDDASRAEHEQAHALTSQFEQVASLLSTMDLHALWSHATEIERRQLIDELVEHVTVQPDHLQVKIHGAPQLNVALQEVGLRGEIGGVGGPNRRFRYRSLAIRRVMFDRWCRRASVSKFN